MTIPYKMSREKPHKGGKPHVHGMLDTLAAAEAHCLRAGTTLTPSRRRVLEILIGEGRPLGAYELIDRLADTTGKRPAPISVYRALDFLLDNGLIHRLASRNSYLACGHGHRTQDLVIFLICEACGEVMEATSEPVRENLADIATKAQFSPRLQVMEIAGRCKACAEP